jgi:hypothetical protein
MASSPWKVVGKTVAKSPHLTPFVGTKPQGLAGLSSPWFTSFMDGHQT